MSVDLGMLRELLWMRDLTRQQCRQTLKCIESLRVVLKVLRFVAVAVQRLQLAVVVFFLAPESREVELVDVGQQWESVVQWAGTLAVLVRLAESVVKLAGTLEALARLANQIVAVGEMERPHIEWDQAHQLDFGME